MIFNIPRLILSWFGIGFVCMVVGTISDYLFYDKKPSRKPMDYIFPVLVGYAGIPILFFSLLHKIKKR